MSKGRLLGALFTATATAAGWMGRPNNGSLPWMPRWDGPRRYRIAFTARSGRTIIRDTQVGSSHERRLLKRRRARPLGADGEPS